MAFDFPASPTAGQEFAAGEVTYLFNGVGWVVKSGGSEGTGSGITQADADLRYVNVTGDTMGGALTLPTMSVNGTYADINWYGGALQRWGLRGADPAASNFEVNRYDNAGGYLGTSLVINRATGNAAFTGAVSTTGLTSNGSIVANGVNGALWSTLTPSTGTLYFGDGSRYLHTDGTNFILQGGQLITTSNIVDQGNLTVSGLTTTTGISNTGTIATSGPVHAGGAGNFGGSVDVTGRLNISASAANLVQLAYFQGATELWNGHVDLSGTNDFIFQRTNAGGPNLPSYRVFANGDFWPSRGLRCSPGASGGAGINTYNLNWDNVGLQGYIDETYLGYISFTSDYRIKKDVVPLSTMWDTVKALNPIRYTQADWIPEQSERDAELGMSAPGPLFVADNIERWGFIAHELQETLVPSAASGVKDAPNQVQSPNPFTVIAALTKALQEAMARIEALESGTVTRRR